MTVSDVLREQRHRLALHCERKLINQSLVASSLNDCRTTIFRASLTAWSTANLPTILAEGACFCSPAITPFNLREHSLENAERFIRLLHKDRARIVTDGTHWRILAHKKEATATQQFISALWLQFIIPGRTFFVVRNFVLFGRKIFAS